MSEASKIFNLIIEFCRNNLDTLMIVGVAAAVLIIIISVVRTSKEDEEDLDYDESELQHELKNAESEQSEQKEETTKDPEDRTTDFPTPDEIESDVKKAFDKFIEGIEIGTFEKESLIREEDCEETATVKDNVVIKDNAVVKDTTCIEAIVGELAELSGKGVREVGIKIPGAEVKITYCDEDEASEMGQDKFADKKVEAVDETNVQAEAEEHNEISKTAENEDEKSEAEAEKLDDEAKPVIKFGPNNMNTTRSGRVYTEEELIEQIKD